ncbi:meiosis inhibitor protein 1-like [Chiloscyllium punctatum]|uniref:meiosis inhibitor protein 1-like n=1 Tax=Chiloscyllium punctatum TaxID=137246 RepID=UPI003B6401A7
MVPLAWHSATDSTNKHIDLDPIYWPLPRTTGTSNQKQQKRNLINFRRHSGNPLLLLLKKFLLSRDETLQIASVQCMTSIVIHSPVEYAPALVYADIPEFLFERLSSTDEILLWSVYSCLLLLTEERLFFSKCHTIYGIESLVRSMKETLRLNSTEVQKQGLLLLGEILKRQPSGIKLFMNFSIWHEVIVVLQEAMTSSSLEVVIEAANALTFFLR